MRGLQATSDYIQKRPTPGKAPLTQLFTILTPRTIQAIAIIITISLALGLLASIGLYIYLVAINQQRPNSLLIFLGGFLVFIRSVISSLLESTYLKGQQGWPSDRYNREKGTSGPPTQ